MKGLKAPHLKIGAFLKETEPPQLKEDDTQVGCAGTPGIEQREVGKMSYFSWLQNCNIQGRAASGLTGESNASILCAAVPFQMNAQKLSPAPPLRARLSTPQPWQRARCWHSNSPGASAKLRLLGRPLCHEIPDPRLQRSPTPYTSTCHLQPTLYPVGPLGKTGSGLNSWAE